MRMLDWDISVLIKEIEDLKNRVEKLEKENEEWAHPDSSINREDPWK